MNDPKNNKDIVERLVCARFGTVEQFFNWYGRWFQRRANAQGVPASDWEDLAKEALRVALDQIQRSVYQGKPEQFPAWLRKIAEGVIYDYWRKQTRRNEIPLPSEAEEYTDDPQELSDKLALKTGMFDSSLVGHSVDFATKQLVDKTLSALPEQEKQFLLLQVQAGLTAKEISMRFGIPENTVSGCLKRAKDAFRIIFTKLSLTGRLLPFTSALRQYQKEKSEEGNG